MFKYVNGDMQMQTDIDLNNKKIKNIPPATNPTDLLMKQSLIINTLSLFGVVNEKKYLTSNGTNITLRSPYLVDVEFYGGSKYSNTQDRLFISVGASSTLWQYPFRFALNNEVTKLHIDHHINLKINNFKLNKAIQIQFILHYLPLSIKST